MTTARLPKRAVAALFLQRQHLDRPRSGRLDGARLTHFAEDVGGIQLDSINVVERAHYLTVWSRFGPYPKAKLDRLAYGDRLLFEYWAHAACLVPAAHFTWWRRAMLDYEPRQLGWQRWLKKNRVVIAAVEEAITARGPLANADFKRAPGNAARGWWSWKPATHALHHLWLTGRTLVHSRVHFQKRYDVAERVMPAARETDGIPSAEAFRDWHARLGLHALGAASEAQLHGYLTFPRVFATVRRKSLRALVERGEVVEVAVEGETAPWFALAEDLPVLEAAAARRRGARGTTLLSPFDSFLWDRGRVQKVFGFDYHIEVYTPGHKRTHGYYSLPIVHEGQLIGRVDPKTHREAKRLEVKHVHFEPWFAKGVPPPTVQWSAIDRDAALAGLADALRSLATFVGADEVTLGRVTPAKLKPALAAALRGAPVAAADEMPSGARA